MGAAALTARITLRSERATNAPTCGLAFAEPGGPLVAVCGLVGGAGTTTLSWLLARQAARESTAPVLLTELSTSRPGLAITTGTAVRLPLVALADEIAQGNTPKQALAEIQPGLRLVASHPTSGRACRPADLRALLGDARAAHGLVVLDCGSDLGQARPVLDAATHVIWVLPARKTALAGARALLDSGAMPEAVRGREAVAAIAGSPRDRCSVRELRALVTDRCERLLLVPYCEQLARSYSDQTSSAVHSALQGWAATLRRRP